MKLYTIGFTRKSAEQFFSLLKENNIQSLIDIRLHPGGQLAGFAKQGDLHYFLHHLADCEYHHVEALAPSADILSAYRKDRRWSTYVEQFEALMDRRGVPDLLDRDLFEQTRCCLLCSEAAPDKCHRRLVAERLARHWAGTDIVHLV